MRASGGADDTRVSVRPTRPARSPRVRARRAAPVVAALVLLGASWFASLGGAATSAVVVSMDVPSATQLTNGCTTAAGRAFGTVLPGTGATTSTAPAACRITFGSSNDTSSLRISQADGTGAAMGRSSTASWPGFEDNANLYADAVAVDATTGWAVGSGGRVLRTANAGTSWTEWNSATTGSGAWWNRIASPPGAAGPLLIGGDDRNLLRVTNITNPTPTFTDISGALSALPATADVVGLAIPAPGIVYLAAKDGSNVWILKSADGGSTFAAPVPMPAISRVADLDATSANEAWIIGTGTTSGIFHTTTGGATAGAWTQIAAPVGRYWFSISAPTATTAYAAGAGGVVWKWDGTSWTQVNSTSQIDVHSISAASSAPNLVWGVGEYGEAYRSADGGLNWARLSTQFTAVAHSVSTFDGTAGIIVGDDRWAGWIADGATVAGRRADPGTPSSSGVAASPVNGQLLLATARDGSIRRSVNGGASWTTQPSGTTVALMDVSFASGSVAWVVGGAGTVLRSADGGVSWTAQPTGFPGRLLAIDAVDETHAWAVGDGGTVLHTTNGGTSWATSNAGTTSQLRAVAAYSDTSVVVGGGSSSIRTTSNGGASWTVGTAPSPYAVLHQIRFASATTLFAVTGYDEVWTSTDAGASWSVTPTNPLGVINSLEVFDANRIVVGGDYGQLHVSDDAGATWSTRTIAMGQALDLVRVDEHTVVSVGRHGGQASTSMSVAANETVADYGGAPANWGGAATTTMFGVCLQTLGGTAAVAAGWLADGGTCTQSDSDPWKAVPAGGTTMATTPTSSTGYVDLVWGMRAALAQRPGRYSATVAFEVLAP
ncbi:MAG: hypothetical protein JWM98_2589 [Thermoleophilia bacterium]|nr:hypothetical protein [Thermoleophilia bacterium]